ncbi:MAG: hypothetical protein IJ264_04810 [Clostridia bacterium]|nr:hypothetical protein [Clostridia bacterium]
MAFAEIIKTIFEFAAVILLIVGFINEKKVVAFEVKLARAIKIHLRNRKARKAKEAAAVYAKHVQSRDAGALYVEEPVLTVVSKTKSSHQVA